MGKFYELFHMDAAIGVSELGLIYMKVGHFVYIAFFSSSIRPAWVAQW